MTDEIETTTDRRAVISKRIDAVGWALFFVMIGGLGLVPEGTVPAGTWLIGTGLIMLGGNLARIAFRLDWIGWTVFLGFVALGFGLYDFFAVELPVFSILIVIVGAHIILKVLLETIRGGKRPPSSKPTSVGQH